MACDHLLLGYIGPETILPATSALAAIGGALMLCGRHVRRACRWCWRLVRPNKTLPPSSDSA